MLLTFLISVTAHPTAQGRGLFGLIASEGLSHVALAPWQERVFGFALLSSIVAGVGGGSSLALLDRQEAKRKSIQEGAVQNRAPND